MTVAENEKPDAPVEIVPPDMDKAWTLIQTISEMNFKAQHNDLGLKLLNVFELKAFSVDRYESFYEDLFNTMADAPIFWHEISAEKGESLFHYACRQGIDAVIIVASSAVSLPTLDSNYLYSCYASYSAAVDRGIVYDESEGKFRQQLLSTVRLSRLLERAKEKNVCPTVLSGIKP
jgi:hypothetical protein